MCSVHYVLCVGDKSLVPERGYLRHHFPSLHLFCQLSRNSWCLCQRQFYHLLAKLSLSSFCGHQRENSPSNTVRSLFFFSLYLWSCQRGPQQQKRLRSLRNHFKLWTWGETQVGWEGWAIRSPEFWHWSRVHHIIQYFCLLIRTTATLETNILKF